MTFASDTVRMLFHQLPTATQVEWEEWEDRMAKRGRRLHIEAVMRHERTSEIVVRIFEQYSFTPGTSAGCA